MPKQKQIEMRVLDCPLMVEDGAVITYVEISFCEACEYHEGIETDQVLCSAEDINTEDDKDE